MSRCIARLPPAPDMDAPEHPVTVLVRETSNDRQSTIDSKVVPTAKVAEAASGCPMTPSAFQALFDRL